ncbi:MAG: DUF3465 domain-containing protein [Methylobacter sp.]
MVDVVAVEMVTVLSTIYFLYLAQTLEGKLMKKLLLVAVLFTGSTLFHNQYSYAFSIQESNSQISGQGVVTRLLADDNKGSRHQKFIIMLPSGQTLLIAHNIDLAPRINSLRVGDSIQFYGEYEWNERGGVVHWTHQDLSGAHQAGWLQHEGKRYQ